MITQLFTGILRWYYRHLSRKANPITHQQRTYPFNIPSREEHRRIPARHYSACQEGKPLIVYFHGGGWVIGDLDTHDALCAALNSITGCAVLSVDYRLAPEHRYPAAHEDAIDATLWATQQLDVLTDSGEGVIVAGDSAGANLAVASALELADHAIPKIMGQVLIYPVTDYYLSNHKSYDEKGSGYALTKTLMHFFWNTYLNRKFKVLTEAQSAAIKAIPAASGQLASLPPTFLSTAENDPLRDEGIAFNGALQAAGVATEHHHFHDSEHGFATSPSTDSNALRQINAISDWIVGLQHKRSVENQI